MKSQPNINVPATSGEKLFHLLALVLFIGIIIYISLTYHSLPDQIPTHINIKGEVDNWGNKISILGLTLVSVPIFIILYFLGKVPHLHNYPVTVTKDNAVQLYKQSRFMFALLNFEIMGVFFLIIWEFVQIAKGNAGFGDWSFAFIIAVIFITVIYFFIKMRKLKPEKQ